jgi:DNA invertase Pin-like site-specific DNA recombinase
MTTTRPRRAIILARISDARNGDDRGVTDQVADGRALAQRLGWGVGPEATHVIVENDTSAFKRRKVKLPDGRSELRTWRPEFRRALELLASGQADGLIAYDLDRACRDPRDLEDLIDVVESATSRLPVESVSGSLRLANDADVTMARVMVAVGNKSSRDTGRRVARARLRQASEGRYGGGSRPFGYEADGVRVRASEAAEIVKAADAILAGVSLRQVTLDLKRRGVPTVSGGQWQTKVLRTILLRPRNAGIASYRGEEVGPASWPAILREDVWRAARAILTDPSRRTTPGNTPRWLGSLLYRCGIEGCSSRLYVSTSGGRRLPAYKCREFDHLSRSAVKVDEVVERVIVARLSRPDAVDLLAEPPVDVDTAALRGEAIALRQARDNLAVEHVANRLSLSALRAGTDAAEARLSEIEAALAASIGTNPAAEMAGRPDAAELWAGYSLGRKRAILDTLMVVTIRAQRPGRQPDGSYFDPETVEITWR